MLDLKYVGRAGRPVYHRTQLLPPRISGKMGEADDQMRALLRARNRLRELAHLAEKALVGANGVAGLTRGQRTQWETLIRKYTSRGSPVAQALAASSRWKGTIEYLAAIKGDPARACDFLHATEQWAELIISAKNKEHAKGKRRGWESWLSRQAARGGGGMRTRGLNAPRKRRKRASRGKGCRARRRRTSLKRISKGGQRCGEGCSNGQPRRGGVKKPTRSVRRLRGCLTSVRRSCAVLVSPSPSGPGGAPTT